ncbi:isoprenylcysteine carboxylmethyltransferase family protein [Jeotgalibacillus sp. R-1-5s-1]|uniref:methyltransferase family protein n=1 Tax=Jeotgalibacillus sp. R-1-5s-1 TaxID=2555897 RepID=UPI00106C3AC8|nr:isoprenylcysteine carboxylmethyltransferase family protein [Jeotgalibacillus sp. R-1-5s-1]TFE02482.1 isoprenylcysteine carboxylmethyltransferase family protein [Jeotgalibacillus sp. R-1-5s-1]
MSIAEWIFILVSAAWVGEFIFFRNRGTGKGDPLETRSFFYILGSLLGAIALALTLQEMRGSGLETALRWTGLILFAGGVFLRYWGILHLKAQFTRHVTVREGDRIVSSGPYRKLRHPLYTGLFLIGIGMTLFFMSLIAAAFGSVALLFTLLYRIQYEEKLLISQFGPEYQEWMKSRYRLIPFIY